MGEVKCQNCFYLEAVITEERKKHDRREKIIEVLKELLLSNHNSFIKGSRESLSDYQKKIAKDNDNLRMRLLTVIESNKTVVEMYNLSLREKQELKDIADDLRNHLAHAKSVISQLWSSCVSLHLPKGKKNSLLKKIKNLNVEIAWDESEVSSTCSSAIMDSVNITSAKDAQQIYDISRLPEYDVSSVSSVEKYQFSCDIASPVSDAGSVDNCKLPFQINSPQDSEMQCLKSGEQFPDETIAQKGSIINSLELCPEESSRDIGFSTVFSHNETLNVANRKKEYSDRTSNPCDNKASGQQVINFNVINWNGNNVPADRPKVNVSSKEGSMQGSVCAQTATVESSKGVACTLTESYCDTKVVSENVLKAPIMKNDSSLINVDINSKNNRIKSLENVPVFMEELTEEQGSKETNCDEKSNNNFTTINQNNGVENLIGTKHVNRNEVNNEPFKHIITRGSSERFESPFKHSSNSSVISVKKIIKNYRMLPLLSPLPLSSNEKTLKMCENHAALSDGGYEEITRDNISRTSNKLKKSLSSKICSSDELADAEIVFPIDDAGGGSSRSRDIGFSIFDDNSKSSNATTESKSEGYATKTVDDEIVFGLENREYSFNDSINDLPPNIFKENSILPVLTPLPPSPKMATYKNRDNVLDESRCNPFNKSVCTFPGVVTCLETTDENGAEQKGCDKISEVHTSTEVLRTVDIDEDYIKDKTVRNDDVMKYSNPQSNDGLIKPVGSSFIDNPEIMNNPSSQNHSTENHTDSYSSRCTSPLDNTSPLTHLNSNCNENISKGIQIIEAAKCELSSSSTVDHQKSVGSLFEDNLDVGQSHSNQKHLDENDYQNLPKCASPLIDGLPHLNSNNCVIDSKDVTLNDLVGGKLSPSPTIELGIPVEFSFIDNSEVGHSHSDQKNLTENDYPLQCTSPLGNLSPYSDSNDCKYDSKDTQIIEAVNSDSSQNRLLDDIKPIEPLFKDNSEVVNSPFHQKHLDENNYQSPSSCTSPVDDESPNLNSNCSKNNSKDVHAIKAVNCESPSRPIIDLVQPVESLFKDESEVVDSPSNQKHLVECNYQRPSSCTSPVDDESSNLNSNCNKNNSKDFHAIKAVNCESSSRPILDHVKPVESLSEDKSEVVDSPIQKHLDENYYQIPSSCTSLVDDELPNLNSNCRKNNSKDVHAIKAVNCESSPRPILDHVKPVESLFEDNSEVVDSPSNQKHLVESNYQRPSSCTSVDDESPNLNSNCSRNNSKDVHTNKAVNYNSSFSPTIDHMEPIESLFIDESEVVDSPSNQKHLDENNYQRPSSCASPVDDESPNLNSNCSRNNSKDVHTNKAVNYNSSFSPTIDHMEPIESLFIDESEVVDSPSNQKHLDENNYQRPSSCASPVDDESPNLNSNCSKNNSKDAHTNKAVNCNSSFSPTIDHMKPVESLFIDDSEVVHSPSIEKHLDKNRDQSPSRCASPLDYVSPYLNSNCSKNNSKDISVVETINCNSIFTSPLVVCNSSQNNSSESTMDNCSLPLKNSSPLLDSKCDQNNFKGVSAIEKINSKLQLSPMVDCAEQVNNSPKPQLNFIQKGLPPGSLLNRYCVNRSYTFNSPKSPLKIKLTPLNEGTENSVDENKISRKFTRFQDANELKSKSGKISPSGITLNRHENASGCTKLKNEDLILGTEREDKLSSSQLWLGRKRKGCPSSTSAKLGTPDVTSIACKDLSVLNGAHPLIPGDDASDFKKPNVKSTIGIRKSPRNLEKKCYKREKRKAGCKNQQIKQNNSRCLKGASSLGCIDSSTSEYLSTLQAPNHGSSCSNVHTSNLRKVELVVINKFTPNKINGSTKLGELNKKMILTKEKSRDSISSKCLSAISEDQNTKFKLPSFKNSMPSAKINNSKYKTEVNKDSVFQCRGPFLKPKIIRNSEQKVSYSSKSHDGGKGTDCDVENLKSIIEEMSNLEFVMLSPLNSPEPLCNNVDADDICSEDGNSADRKSLGMGSNNQHFPSYVISRNDCLDSCSLETNCSVLPYKKTCSSATLVNVSPSTENNVETLLEHYDSKNIGKPGFGLYKNPGKTACDMKDGVLEEQGPVSQRDDSELSSNIRFGFCKDSNEASCDKKYEVLLEKGPNSKHRDCEISSNARFGFYAGSSEASGDKMDIVLEDKGHVSKCDKDEIFSTISLGFYKDSCKAACDKEDGVLQEKGPESEHGDCENTGKFSFGFYKEYSEASSCSKEDPVLEKTYLKRKLSDTDATHIESNRKMRRILLDCEVIPCEEDAFLCSVKYFSEEALKQPKPKKTEKCTLRDLSLIETKVLSLLHSPQEIIPSIFNDVVDSLKHISPGYIADIIVDAIHEDDDEVDLTHTPPAPPLTVRQQKLIMLAIALAAGRAEYINIILKTFEDCLVSFSKIRLKVNQMCNLVTFHTALCQSQGLLNRSRTLIFDLIYTRDVLACNLIFTMMCTWPDVFPQALDSSNCILTKTIVYYIFQKFQHFKETKKHMLVPLKSYLEDYGYEITILQTCEKDVLCSEIINNIASEGSGISLVLLCKVHGWTWSLTVVEKKLLPIVRDWLQGNVGEMVVSETILCIGRILRAIPATVAISVVRTTLETLETVLNHQESVSIAESAVQAISMLRNHNFQHCAAVLKKWCPKNKFITTKMASYIKIILSLKPLTYWH